MALRSGVIPDGDLGTIGSKSKLDMHIASALPTELSLWPPFTRLLIEHCFILVLLLVTEQKRWRFQPLCSSLKGEKSGEKNLILSLCRSCPSWSTFQMCDLGQDNPRRFHALLCLLHVLPAAPGSLVGILKELEGAWDLAHVLLATPPLLPPGFYSCHVQYLMRKYVTWN